MSDVTFVIQGMLHPNCISALPLYLMHGDVIISSWDACPGLLKDGAVNSKSRMIPHYVERFQNFYSPKVKNKVKTILRKSKSRKQIEEEKIYNYNNAYYQFDSTLAGLSQVTTKYVVKLRCDEFYTFIDPVLDKIREPSSKPKLTTSNTWFRKSEEFPWHPSDHIVAGKTDIMLNAFKKAREFCMRGGYFEDKDAKRIVGQGENFTRYKFNEPASGEKRFDTIEVANKNKIISSLNLWLGQKNYVDVAPSEDVFITIPKRKKKTIKAIVEYESPIQSPVKIGDKLGLLKIYISDELIKEIEVLSVENIKKSNIFSRLFKSLNYLVWGDV